MRGWLILLLAGQSLLAGPTFQQSFLYKSGKEFCDRARITVYPYHERFTGNSEGIFAPFLRTRDGGLLAVGTAEGDSHAVVTRLDRTGRVVWQKALKREGRPAIEGASAAETADGSFYINTQVYFHPSTMAQIWILKLDSNGNTVWDVGFRGFGNDNNPVADRLQITPENTIRIKGHIYPTMHDMRSEKSHLWAAEIGEDGKVLSDVTDPPGMTDGEDEIDARYPW